jgi:hypothetical protein
VSGPFWNTRLPTVSDWQCNVELVACAGCCALQHSLFPTSLGQVMIVSVGLFVSRAVWEGGLCIACTQALAVHGLAPHKLTVSHVPACVWISLLHISYLRTAVCMGFLFRDLYRNACLVVPMPPSLAVQIPHRGSGCVAVAAPGIPFLCVVQQWAA